MLDERRILAALARGVVKTHHLSRRIHQYLNINPRGFVLGTLSGVFGGAIGIWHKLLPAAALPQRTQQNTSSQSDIRVRELSCQGARIGRKCNCRCPSPLLARSRSIVIVPDLRRKN